MKLLTLFSLLWLFPFLARPEGSVSYRVENRTADTLVADVWINSSCFHMVKETIAPGQTQEICLDWVGRNSAKEMFGKNHENLVGSLMVYRSKDVAALMNTTRVDSIHTYSFKSADWEFHRRSKNNGVAILKIESSDLR